MSVEFIQLQKRQDGESAPAPLYSPDVDGEPFPVKVKAACCNSDRATGLFLWAEPTTSGDSNIYPLATWSSGGDGLDFDFTAPLTEWRDRFGLQSVVFGQISELPEKEQSLNKHPLAQLCSKEGLGLGMAVSTLQLFSALSHFSRLYQSGDLRGESFPAFNRLLEKLKRINTSDPEPSTLAFLLAMSTIGESRAVVARYQALS